MIELFTGMRRVQLGKLVEDCSPIIQDKIIAHNIDSNTKR